MGHKGWVLNDMLNGTSNHTNLTFHVSNFLLLTVIANFFHSLMICDSFVSCIISFSRQLPFFLIWQFPLYSSFFKNPFICFLSCPWNPQKLSQTCSTKRCRRVSSFFLIVQLLQPYVATDHTNVFISRIRWNHYAVTSIFPAVMPWSPALCLTFSFGLRGTL